VWKDRIASSIFTEKRLRVPALAQGSKQLVQTAGAKIGRSFTKWSGTNEYGDSVAQKRLGLAGRTGLPDRRIKRKLDSYQARFFGTHKRVSVLTNGEATEAPDKNSINLKRKVT
jgi:hypothetical protein